MKKFYEEYLKPELTMYTINTVIFGFITLGYAYITKDSMGIYEIHDIYINSDFPYRTLIIIAVYFVLAFILGIIKVNKNIKILMLILDSLASYAPSVLFSLGFLLSGILLGTSLFIGIEQGFDYLFIKYIIATIACFSILFIFGLLFKFIMNGFKGSIEPDI